MEDLISVIVPIYNVERYLKQCIDSILKQTYLNIEIILVDDGSPDSCGSICEKYKKIDKRIIVIHKKNGGLSDARNEGIKKASGKYITFIDSDDDVEKDYIEYLYKLIKNNKTKMSIAAYTVVSQKKKINIGKGFREINLTTEECLERMLCEEGFSVSAWAKLYDKRLFNNVEFPKGKLNEDNGTTYKLILQCENIAYGNKSIYNYYKRENSIMTSKFNFRKMDLIELTDEMCNVIDEKYPNLIDSTNKKRITSRFSILRQIVVGENDNDQKIIEEDMEKYIKKRKKQILLNKKMKIREKIALITIIMGKAFFTFSWKVYCKIKY